MGHAASQGLGGHVDQLDLVGSPHDVVGDGLPLFDARDALDDVVEGFEVLDVDRRDHGDAGSQQLLDVLVALRVPGAGDVGVGQLVDQGDLRPASENSVDVHLLEGGAVVLDGPAGHDLQVADLLGGPLAAVGLDEPDDHVATAVTAPAPLVEHGECLADPRCRPEVDPQLATPVVLPLRGRAASERHERGVGHLVSSRSPRRAPG